MKIKTIVIAVAVASATWWLAPSSVYALASFARQTGLACSACHMSFPELTPVGRDFKLHGFTTSVNNLTEEGTNKGSALSLIEDVPLSISFQTSVTATDRSQPSSQSPSVEFPQQINFWLAGQITPHFGTFLQLTYTASSDTFSGDSSDVRFFGTETKLAGKSLVWGIDANNNPTIEDLWNSTPAFGFAYANPDSAGFLPAAATMIDGALATQVIGGGPYVMLDNHLYALVEVYRSQHLGTPQPENGVTGTVPNPINIQAVAPYWRLAWQQNIGKNNYFEVGTYGIYVSSYPGAVSGPTDSYVDFAGDASYELTLANGDMIVLHSTFIHEMTNLGASVAAGNASQANDDLNTFRLDASYHFGSKLTFTAGPFLTWGTSDVLRYPAGSLSGYSNGSPNNNGFLVQAAYWPWQNFEIGLQYRGFITFNGASTNYDGNGRNASDNNTFYGFVWINF
jgi:hypothetical protein